MHVIPTRPSRAAVAALVLLLAASAQAQLKLPGSDSGGSTGGTGLRTAPQLGSQPAPPSTAASKPSTVRKAATKAVPAAKAAEAASAPATAAASAPSAAADPALGAKEVAAGAAAAGWLTLLDRKDWGTAWETTAGMFRGSVPLDRWMDGAPKTRADLGALQARAQTNATYKTEFPGKPKGDYVTVLFTSRFEKRTVEELVTTVLEPDGRWRVTGYGAR